MRNLLKQYFGYDEFRPLQEEIIQTVLDRKDALVLMPTGGGKSLCYQLPALKFDGITLVVSPLIALMKDQVDALTENGIAAAFLNSTLRFDEIDAIQRRAIDGSLKVLYVAPERLATPGFQSFLRQLNLSFIAIDEAHCISEWGHDFRPEYRNLKDLRHAFPDAPVMALTATATPRVREDIVHQLKLQDAKAFLSSFNRPNLQYTVRPKSDSFGQLVSLLGGLNNNPAIIYCFSRKDTEALADDLRRTGFKALPYHAGLERDLRRQTQEQFIRDEVTIIVATIAFGMGIDKPDVRLVAHMDLPKTIEGYYQETGRAGRDGLPSECVLFYSFGDKRKQEYFIDQIQDEQERDLARKKLAQMIDYCETSNCRRQYLLQYFGESWDAPSCGSCDACVASPESPETDATEIAQKILSTILRTGEKFGVIHIIHVLRGSRREQVFQYHHENLSVYGTAKGHSATELREYMRLLLKKGYVEKNEGEYPTLRVSKMGKAALIDRTQIPLPQVTVGTRSITPGPFGAPRDAKTGLPFEKDLFEDLRRVRKELADTHGVPPFIIFGDRTLQEMSYFLPRSKERLGGLFGVGQTKLEAYGDAFLASIRSYAVSRGLPERPAPSHLPPPPSRPPASVNRPSSTYQQTKDLVEKKLSLAAIARERNLSEGTIVGHIVALLQQRTPLEIAYLRPADDRLQAIREAYKKAGTNMLTPVKMMLGDGYSYDEIKLARLFL
ncbi:DNA helicase RecQ [Candidatus Uhrbacteria bacterium]|nr:DNA helicase RecQ [Candidatus Uhrbacteria bacterium]